MAFNLGIGRQGTAASFAMQTTYLYESAIYRRWVTDIAMSFYSGRQDEFVWLDLKKQFRNPDKQTIVPYNLTKEIIDETSILYREEPVYFIKDKNGKVLDKDMKLWKKIRKEARYHSLCQQLDSMTKLLGTVLVKVSFVDPDTGDLVNENKPGMVQFDLVYGGSYDVKYTSSPYYLSKVTFGFDAGSANLNSPVIGGTVPMDNTLSVAMKPGASDKRVRQVNSIRDIKKITRIFWDKNMQRVEDADGNYYEGENPYGCIPAIPFFNQDPGHYYFLPVNEPLLYANHAVNMRLTDLNHIAKYQSFGQAVVKGIERPINNRLGRPIDDMNVRGGSRGGLGFGFGRDASPTGLDRNNFNPFDFFGDGNAQANMNGFSIGPDTVVSVGETGDFKFESPGADIKGLTSTIYTMMDMIRINHGLQPKHNTTLPPSGAALMISKLGVVEQNKKRQILFREREQQLFQVVKKLWNKHWESEGSDDLFSEEGELEVHYVDPEFVVDPQTKVLNLEGEMKILNSGNVTILKKLYPHLDEDGIKDLLKKNHKERLEQAKRDAELQEILQPEAEEVGAEKSATPKPKIRNKVEHAVESSIQPGKNGDLRESKKTIRARKQKQLEAESKEE